MSEKQLSVRAMIQKNNELREQMTPANRDYYEDIVVYLRDSSVNQQEREKYLLELAQQVLDAQQAGRSAASLLGSDPIAYAKQAAAKLPAVKPFSRNRTYAMIPWIALTWFFFIEAVVGFLAQWLGGDSEAMTTISLFTLILVAVGAVLLVEAVTKLLNRPQDQEETSPKIKFNAKSIGIYIVITALILILGTSFRNSLPVFTIKPWVSLLLFGIGLLGHLAFFRKRS